MQTISDLPAHAIDQIVGIKHASYTAIRLWLCGDTKLQRKLSVGLTYLDLSAHFSQAFNFPRMILELKSLRHLSIDAKMDMISHREWTVILTSMPNTLESLSISGCDVSIRNIDEHGKTIQTAYPRGSTASIDFASLFPRIHTLKLRPRLYTLQPMYSSCEDEVEGSSWFASLPASLTHLEVRAVFSYTRNLRAPQLSKLPPGLLVLKGDIYWNLSEVTYDKAGDISGYAYSEAAIDAFRLDCANAPPGLQILAGVNIPLEGDFTILKPPYRECWLPKSLLEIEWINKQDPIWMPSVARTMPPNLHTLSLHAIDMDSYVDTYTNWVADLPRKLTSLTLNLDKDIDFVTYGRFLPPGLTQLELCLQPDPTSGAFGDWSSIGGNDYWPSTLTSLDISTFWLAPHEIVNLPRALVKLHVSFGSHPKRPEGGDRPVLHTRLLPSTLIKLYLAWDDSIKLELSFPSSQARSLDLRYMHERLVARFNVDRLQIFPDTLEFLRLDDIFLGIASNEIKATEALLPNLTRLEVGQSCLEVIPLLPRRIQHLEIDYLRGIANSTLLADGQLFMHLPPLLTTFVINGESPEILADFVLPPQDFNHLPHLTRLVLYCAPSISSSILRTLPRTLRRLQLRITDLNKDDLPYLPPHLVVCNFPNPTAELIEYLPLASLDFYARYENLYNTPHAKLAKERVRQAALHQ